jgi:septal ring factor EnvC (AmiA/AmiB activator)
LQTLAIFLVVIRHARSQVGNLEQRRSGFFPPHFLEEPEDAIAKKIEECLAEIKKLNEKNEALTKENKGLTERLSNANANDKEAISAQLADNRAQLARNDKAIDAYYTQIARLDTQRAPQKPPLGEQNVVFFLSFPLLMYPRTF